LTFGTVIRGRYPVTFRTSRSAWAGDGLERRYIISSVVRCDGEKHAIVALFFFEDQTSATGFDETV